jgi:CHAT domain-containing protein/uncharacterized protein HemY
MGDTPMTTTENSQQKADRLLHLGNVHYQKSRFREALASWQKALTIYKKIRDRHGEAASLGYLGIVYEALGQYQKAFDFYQEYLTIVDGSGMRVSPENYIYFRKRQHYWKIPLFILTYRIEARLEELEALLNKAYPAQQPIPQSKLRTAYQSLAQYQKEIDFHQQYLAIASEIGDREGEANSLGNLGNAYYSLGEFQLAKDCHQKSLAIASEIGDREGEANSLGNLGNAYYSLGEFQLAKDCHQKSLDIASEIGDRQGKAIAWGNLGNVYQSLGEFQLAKDCHQKSLAIASEIGDRQGEAIAGGNLGNAYDSLGQYQLAINYHKELLTVARERGYSDVEAISLNNLGETRKKINQFPEAEEELWQAIKIWERLREGLDDRHKISIFETQIAAYRNLQEVLVAQDKFTAALEISERGRTRAFIELLRQKLSEPEKGEKAEKITDYLTTYDIQKVAKTQNATLVEYSIVTEEIYIWVISPTGDIKFRRANLQPLESLNKSLKNLKEIILKARVSIGIEEKDSNGKKIKLDTLEKEYKQDSQGNFPLLQLLHEILIAPIADILPKDPENSVIFIPHYALFLVPFAALQTPQGRYLIEDHTPLTAPSIQVLETTHEQYQRVRDKPKKALVVAEPTLHETFQKDYKLKPYEFMKEAGESIARILETRAITGNDATKIAVINAMLETRIIHIFAHAIDEYQNEKEAKVGIPGNIILAPDGENEGALNAGEILDLELNSEIVVLSACSTGKGKITGDGIMGLSRCFILAGVPSLIVSLWNIGAPAAKVLMTQFYQNLTLGKNRAAALRHAMIETKKRFHTPKSWAAFTLIGETQPLTLTTKNIQEALRAMAIPDNATPKEIVEAFSRLFDIYPPEFLREIYGLNLQPTDTIEESAAKITAWCKTHQNVEENIENELCEMGLSDADDDKPELDENVVETNYQKYLDNINRHGLPADSSTKTENKDDSASNS